MHRNQFYRHNITLYLYSFWGLRPQTSTGALPLDPAGRLPSHTCEIDWWGRPFLPEILGQADPVGAKWPIFQGPSTSAVTPSKIFN